MWKNIITNSSSKEGIKNTIVMDFNVMKINMLAFLKTLILFQFYAKVFLPSHTCIFVKGVHAFLYVMISFSR
jgi:hypothetical protein